MDYVRTDLALGKRLVLKFAGEHFLKHKRCVEVMIRGYDVNVVVSYRGKRDEESIKAGMEIERVVSK